MKPPRFIPTYVGHTVCQAIKNSLNRFIPTYVGHTVVVKCCFLHFPVHPHIRGAYGGEADLSSSCIGSSPHTWGIRSNSIIGSPFQRFIPTYVGHTARKLKTMPLQRGSSPHTWGIRFSGLASKITSAVHPHIRGAYDISPNGQKIHLGSSPHTWGILNDCIVKICIVRFIPTYVGHTFKPAGQEAMDAVHPHIRGAYFCCSAR